MSTSLQLSKTKGGAVSREREREREEKRTTIEEKTCKFFIRASTQMDAHMRAHRLGYSAKNANLSLLVMLH